MHPRLRPVFRMGETNALGRAALLIVQNALIENGVVHVIDEVLLPSKMRL